MHPTKTVHLGCTDCHGGNSSVAAVSGATPNSSEYNSVKEKAHVQPRDPSFKNRATLPERIFTNWLKESAEYIKFVNPGDLRVAPETCGTLGCHTAETRAVSTSMMTHAGMLWGAALYNNGAYPTKNTRFGESYDRGGVPQAIKTSPTPTPEETRAKGVIPELDPLFRWESSQPGNVLRVFERGGRKKAEVGNPNREEDPGRPDDKLSDRGLGCAPTLFFLGYRKRACSIRSYRFQAPTIILATIAEAVAQRATSFMRMIATRRIRPRMRHSATPASALLLIRQFRRTSPGIPSNTFSRSRSLRVSA
jgi:hypothetical protein